MINKFVENLNLIAYLSIILLTILLIIRFLPFILKKIEKNSISTKLDKQFIRIKKEIEESVKPAFIDIKPSTADFMHFAIEVWRIEKRINNVDDALSENQKSGLENSVKKLKKYLDKNDIEIVDYTGQKYNEGMNLDILSAEKDFSVQESRVKETVEPSILHRGQIIKKAKIIVINL